jgi:hypothetical protein
MNTPKQPKTAAQGQNVRDNVSISVLDYIKQKGWPDTPQNRGKATSEIFETLFDVADEMRTPNGMKVPKLGVAQIQRNEAWIENERLQATAERLAEAAKMLFDGSMVNEAYDAVRAALAAYQGEKS